MIPEFFRGVLSGLSIGTKHYILSGNIQNYKFTVNNIATGDSIYGPLVPLLQEFFRKYPQHSAQVTIFPIPSPVLTLHPSDSISVDFFFVKHKPYLLMKLRVHKFRGLNSCRG